MENAPILPIRAELAVTDLIPFGYDKERSFFALTLARPQWAEWKPGQFIMLRPNSWNCELTWARPFSICRVTPQSLVLFFQVAGRGTKEIAKLKPKDTVTVWGPLGTPFAVENKPTLLLAGGIGIAPFAGYVEQHPVQNQLSMFFSHRLPEQYYPVESLTRHIEVETRYEQKQEDLTGTIQTIRQKMEETAKKNGLVLACGPMPFLKTVWKNALELNVSAQLSLEQRMACGIGACLGCVSVTSALYPDKEKAGLPVQTCTKGPVFWAHELNLDAQ
ncbi:MAG: dihydroorotate dehydrogenase electron transfer subunit [Mailhella sp.]